MGERKRRIVMLESEVIRLTLDVAALKAKAHGAVTIPQAIAELLAIVPPTGMPVATEVQWRAGVAEAIAVLRRLSGSNS